MDDKVEGPSVCPTVIMLEPHSGLATDSPLPASSACISEHEKHQPWQNFTPALHHCELLHELQVDGESGPGPHNGDMGLDSS